ncbi:MAG: glucose-1-phosphate cytidylyltransferase [Rhodospirillales bacterium]|jgi:glucose-1-phosphate cytidylyltransferase|nr:glucose-1-phosphate cytidylyltransferase [Rhodospirillales bacterium]MDP7216588.1 glucose-1-phosphate cytidylyltransferase [Rhodospirillales bacterium]HIJ43847.1 glucose-1-phosphate cytidylyltransferase [Rhodospirillaceae bacterium]HIJ92060.1 glucose-1-phosphate cytidylyltransferase [Rhodospirillaceae bacterium]HJP53410.1 glucose-1-phosphate cytidylyltransferase [Rhodospirillales bacterium]
MKVVILCGGRGTRIRDVADNIPKPMVPVGEFPILWHIMKSYAGGGYTDFVLCLGYQQQAIKDFFLNYEAHTGDFTLTLGADKAVEYHGAHDEEGWKVTLADTGLDALTGARVKRVARYLEGDENFMLTYGDGLGDIDYEALVDFHRSHGRILTVTGVRPPGRFGELAGDESGLVTEFNEKPQATGGRISGGFFVCRRELFDYLDDRQDLVFEQEPLRALVGDGQMMVYRHDGFWQCMDTYRDYRLLNGLWEGGEAAWKNW